MLSPPLFARRLARAPRLSVLGREVPGAYLPREDGFSRSAAGFSGDGARFYFGVGLTAPHESVPLGQVQVLCSEAGTGPPFKLPFRLLPPHCAVWGPFPRADDEIGAGAPE